MNEHFQQNVKTQICWYYIKVIYEYEPHPPPDSLLIHLHTDPLPLTHLHPPLPTLYTPPVQSPRRHRTTSTQLKPEFHTDKLECFKTKLCFQHFLKRRDERMFSTDIKMTVLNMHLLKNFLYSTRGGQKGGGTASITTDTMLSNEVFFFQQLCIIWVPCFRF